MYLLLRVLLYRGSSSINTTFLRVSNALFYSIYTILLARVSCRSVYSRCIRIRWCIRRRYHQVIIPTGNRHVCEVCVKRRCVCLWFVCSWSECERASERACARASERAGERASRRASWQASGRASERAGELCTCVVRKIGGGYPRFGHDGEQNTLYI
jgi:hypothetical protein